MLNFEIDRIRSFMDIDGYSISVRYLEVILNKVIIRFRADENICGKWIMITSCNTSTKQARTFAVLLIKIII